ncbi:hypothetical protein TNIN_423471 [Trichonephila inaurata madagascariensis]|uniref:Uncharacterized protein n=1 Tax=Trichonephila inaurata madagascariensis TaxID=2747483 RepID=A0A8X6YAI8_9ARAC|nr:hypothetical protein TNIN_423471 [Trichonephila inaurata madagascariensis]
MDTYQTKQPKHTVPLNTILEIVPFSRLNIYHFPRTYKLSNLDSIMRNCMAAFNLALLLWFWGDIETILRRYNRSPQLIQNATQECVHGWPDREIVYNPSVWLRR